MLPVEVTRHFWASRGHDIPYHTTPPIPPAPQPLAMAFFWGMTRQTATNPCNASSLGMFPLVGLISAVSLSAGPKGTSRRGDKLANTLGHLQNAIYEISPLAKWKCLGLSNTSVVVAGICVSLLTGKRPRSVRFGIGIVLRIGIGILLARSDVLANLWARLSSLSASGIYLTLSGVLAFGFWVLVWGPMSLSFRWIFVCPGRLFSTPQKKKKKKVGSRVKMGKNRMGKGERGRDSLHEITLHTHASN